MKVVLKSSYCGSCCAILLKVGESGYAFAPFKSATGPQCRQAGCGTPPGAGSWEHSIRGCGTPTVANHIHQSPCEAGAQSRASRAHLHRTGRRTSLARGALGRNRRPRDWGPVRCKSSELRRHSKRNRSETSGPPILRPREPAGCIASSMTQSLGPREVCASRRLCFLPRTAGGGIDAPQTLLSQSEFVLPQGY